jgi:hypothetical protein
MPVFDARKKTKTRRPLDGDNWKPQMGALQKGSPAAEQALIHGDRELQIEGNLRSVTLKNRTLLTAKNYHCQVMGDRFLTDLANLTHTTMGREVRNILGPAIRNCVGPVTASFVAPLTETHCSPRSISEPTSLFESVQNALKQYNIDLNATVASIQMTLSDLSLKGSSFGYTLLECEDSKINLKKEEAKIVINSLSYTQIVSVNTNITALFLATGMTASSLKMAANSYAM